MTRHFRPLTAPELLALALALAAWLVACLSNV